MRRGDTAFNGILCIGVNKWLRLISYKITEVEKFESYVTRAKSSAEKAAHSPLDFIKIRNGFVLSSYF